jgi:hypothetical protein
MNCMGQTVTYEKRRKKRKIYVDVLRALRRRRMNQWLL